MKFLLIDGNNLAFRAVAGRAPLPRQPLGSSFLRSLHTSLDRARPHRAWIVWDGGISSWRQKLVSHYKKRQKGKQSPKILALREAVVEEKKAFDEISPFLPIGSWEVSGYEADDLINAGVLEIQRLWAAHERNSCCVDSTDRDFFQLLSRENVLLYRPDPYSRTCFASDYGFPPDKWPEYRALVGDASDNLSGLHGIGDLTAKRILSLWGSTAKFLSAPDAHEFHGKKQAIEMLTSHWKAFLAGCAVTDFSRFPSLEKLKFEFRRRIVSGTSSLEWDKEGLYAWLKERRQFDLVNRFGRWSEPFESLWDMTIPF